MTDVFQQPVQTMTVEERLLASDVYRAVQDYSRYDKRGMQSAEYRVGISDLGFCSERTRRMLLQMDPDDTDVLAAFTGTALGDHIERAVAKAHPEWLIQQTVTVPLRGERAVYHVSGHPDIVDPSGRLIDVKTTRGLEIVRRKGASQQQQYQRHCYAKGAWLAGMFGDIPLEQVEVANLWMDRACDDKEFHVHMEPYSEDMVTEATMWLDDVVYAYAHGQDARKEPPREMCAKVCGFFSTCRALDTDVDGLITDETVLAAIDMHQEAMELERQAKRLKSQARANIPPTLVGSTGEYSVRWVHVNGTHVEYDRAGYDRLDVKAVK